MVTITIPKTEYEQLSGKALKYEYLRQLMEEDIFVPPPIKNIKKVISEFKKTGLYNRKFLESFKKGLKQSSYFKA